MHEDPGQACGKARRGQESSRRRGKPLRQGRGLSGAPPPSSEGQAQGDPAPEPHRESMHHGKGLQAQIVASQYHRLDQEVERQTAAKRGQLLREAASAAVSQRRPIQASRYAASLVAHRLLGLCGSSPRGETEEDRCAFTEAERGKGG